MQSTICIVKYKNTIEVQRLLWEVSTTKGEYELIIIDNDGDMFELIIPPRIVRFTVYRNYNLGQLAGATNEAIRLANGKYFVYLCGNHTHINSPDWLEYMIGCLKDRAMGGTVSPYQVHGRSGMHVQGGCFIANTEVLKKVRYDEVQYPFSFMDVDISAELLKRGYELVDMPEVKSVMGEVKDKHKYKIYHSHV